MSEKDVLALLTSIDQSMRKLVVLVERKAEERVKNAVSSGGKVASDADLDSTHGDQEVRFNPRDWSGPSMKGRKWSECPAEFLELLSVALDHFAEKAESEKELTSAGKPVAPYKRADAARCRGWALRVRSGKVKQNDNEEPDWESKPWG